MAKQPYKFPPRPAPGQNPFVKMGAIKPTPADPKIQQGIKDLYGPGGKAFSDATKPTNPHLKKK